MTHIPSHTTGLIPVRMRLDETDQFGNGIARFSFNHYEDGEFQGAFDFTSLDAAEVSTSGLDQQLAVEIMITPDSVDSLPLVDQDAGVQTLSDAPATSALETQTISLSLGGSLVGKWSVTFEVPIHEFSLDGAWVKL